MYTLTIIIIFMNLLQATFTEHILNSSVQNEEQAAQLFAQIRPKKVLPFILFKVNTGKRSASGQAKFTLRIPEDVIEAVTLDKKMVKGTKFLRTDSKFQSFFCPKKNSEETCLVSKSFKESIQLRCAKEPIPLIEKEEVADLCGEDDAGTAYYIAYSICPDEKYDTTEITIYTFCYDATKRKTLYTVHAVYNPLLLKSNLLYRERNVSYPFMANNQFKPLNFEGINIPSNTDLNLLTHPQKADYGVQKLVPDTDFAFALWRKPTYQNFNFDWQHKTLIPLWNKINSYVKSEAILMKVLKRNIDMYIHTAVVDFIASPNPEDNTQIYNIWVKVVTTTPFSSSEKTKSKGIAILMNNFITSTTDDSIASSSSTEPIDKFCKDTLCVKSFVDEFKNVGGQVRCCSLTKEIGTVGIWKTRHRC